MALNSADRYLNGKPRTARLLFTGPIGSLYSVGMITGERKLPWHRYLCELTYVAPVKESKKEDEDEAGPKVATNWHWTSSLVIAMTLVGGTDAIFVDEQGQYLLL